MLRIVGENRVEREALGRLAFQTSGLHRRLDFVRSKRVNACAGGYAMGPFPSANIRVNHFWAYTERFQRNNHNATVRVKHTIAKHSMHPVKKRLLRRPQDSPQ